MIHPASSARYVMTTAHVLGSGRFSPRIAASAANPKLAATQEVSHTSATPVMAPKI